MGNSCIVPEPPRKVEDGRPMDRPMDRLMDRPMDRTIPILPGKELLEYLNNQMDMHMASVTFRAHPHVYNPHGYGTIYTTQRRFFTDQITMGKTIADILWSLKPDRCDRFTAQIFCLTIKRLLMQPLSAYLKPENLTLPDDQKLYIEDDERDQWHTATQLKLKEISWLYYIRATIPDQEEKSFGKIRIVRDCGIPEIKYVNVPAKLKNLINYHLRSRCKPTESDEVILSRINSCLETILKVPIAPKHLSWDNPDLGKILVGFNMHVQQQETMKQIASRVASLVVDYGFTLDGELSIHVNRCILTTPEYAEKLDGVKLFQIAQHTLFDRDFDRGGIDRTKAIDTMIQVQKIAIGVFRTPLTHSQTLKYLRSALPRLIAEDNSWLYHSVEGLRTMLNRGEFTTEQLMHYSEDISASDLEESDFQQMIAHPELLTLFFDRAEQLNLSNEIVFQLAQEKLTELCQKCIQLMPVVKLRQNYLGEDIRYHLNLMEETLGSENMTDLIHRVDTRLGKEVIITRAAPEPSAPEVARPRQLTIRAPGYVNPAFYYDLEEGLGKKVPDVGDQVVETLCCSRFYRVDAYVESHRHGAKCTYCGQALIGLNGEEPIQAAATEEIKKTETPKIEV